MAAEADGDRWLKRVHELANTTLKVAHKRAAQPLVDEILDVGSAVQGQVTFAVVGRRSFGKSKLLATLVGAAATPSQTDVATSTYIEITYGRGLPRAVACFREPERGEQEIGLDELADYAVVGGRHADAVAFVRVLVDSPVLRDGIRLIDTPGLGGRDRTHEAVTLRVLEDADAVLIVLDAEQPVTDDEREVFERVRAHVRHVLLIANKAEGEHAEQLAFNEAALGAPILPVSALLGSEADALRAQDPDGAVAVRQVSGLDALEAELRSAAGAVRRDRYRLLLDCTSSALDELAAPDREQVELAQHAGDPAVRLQEIAEELERLGRINPPGEVNLRFGHLRQERLDHFRARVAPAFRALKEEVGQSWDGSMTATLPIRCETIAKGLWADALMDVRRRAKQIATELDVQLDLGVGPRSALLELTRTSRAELPATYRPGDDVLPPPDPQSRTEAAMRKSMRVTMTAGAANLALAPLIPLAGVPGLNLVVLPVALPLGLYLGRREDQAIRERASRQAALTYVSECQNAVAGLANPLAARISRAGEYLARQYQQRWLARRDTLTRTASQIRTAGADLRAAQARLDELAALLQTRDELQQEL